MENLTGGTPPVRYLPCVVPCKLYFGLSYVTGVAMGLGAIGVWIAMIIDWIVRISFFVTRFFSGKWKTFYHGE